ncbi:Kif4a type kinesin-like protein, partial [Dunaliella salina]
MIFGTGQTARYNLGAMDTNVKVAVRVRPLIEREAAEGATPCVLADEELACVGLGHDRKFTFDYAFGSGAKQEDVYSACVAPLVESCFEGYNGTVFAYGQTGSGSSSSTLMKATSSTLMNDASSRSHVVASITITQHTTMQPSGDGGLEVSAPGVQMVTKAKLHLVDLAGSERVKKSGVADNQPGVTYRGTIGSAANGALTARFKEAVNINQGLLALGSVISALGDEKKKGSHVPYRDSRLTRLLQDSLGGNSRTAMIACVSPADNSLEESLNTLKWAHRTRNISNRPEANCSAEGANKQAALVAMQ